MNKYLVTPNNGEAFEVEADKFEHDTNSGRFSFFTGTELVASLINVSVRKQSAPAPTA